MTPCRQSAYPDKNPWLSALWYAVATVLIYSMFISVLLPRAGGHPWGFMGFSRHLTLDHQELVPDRFISSEFGYDGQAYFVLALSPFVRDPAGLGFRFDNQALRQQRILYPFIVHLLAWGDSSRTAWFMLIINVLTVGGLVALAVWILHRMGQPAWLSLLVGFYPGLAVSVSRGLTEPLCLAWVLSAILAWRRRPLLAGGFLCLAVLTRETGLLVAAGFGCAWLWGIIKKDSLAPSVRIWLPPLVIYLLWQGFILHWVTGSVVGTAASEKIGWPLEGLIEALKEIVSVPTPDNLFFLFFIVMTIGWQLFVATAAGSRRDPLFLGWGLYCVLLSVVGMGIWDNSPSLLRVSSEWNLMGFLWVAASGYCRWKPVATVWASAWLLSAAGEWYRYGLIAG